MCHCIGIIVQSFTTCCFGYDTDSGSDSDSEIDPVDDEIISVVDHDDDDPELKDNTYKGPDFGLSSPKASRWSHLLRQLLNNCREVALLLRL